MTTAITLTHTPNPARLIEDCLDEQRHALLTEDRETRTERDELIVIERVIEFARHQQSNKPY